MPDALKRIFELQRQFRDRMSDRYPLDGADRISVLSTAIIHEAVELQRETNWKWWKKPVQPDLPRIRTEIIDIWHFLVQASIEAGMEPSDILSEYEKKYAENIRRQEDDY